MSWLSENCLFLNYFEQFKQIEAVFLQNKCWCLCLQYEKRLKLQESVTSFHLDIYTWYSIYTQMKYCKYSLQALECVHRVPVRVPPERLIVPGRTK